MHLFPGCVYPTTSTGPRASRRSKHRGPDKHELSSLKGFFLGSRGDTVDDLGFYKGTIMFLIRV